MRRAGSRNTGIAETYGVRSKTNRTFVVAALSFIGEVA
jgi:hypothetical protein